ncbi:hypothetical protein DY000_02024118 [Brassica cretica]|uniref:Uncharacterized protein n=1 Tax=Brassica cretica TaxID=69181 RepID=A0ABQ7E6I3_BRACR|nr:hypothetical protein DY000_02024118 [Brassica cretica]
MRIQKTRVHRKNYVPTENVPQTLPTSGVPRFIPTNIVRRNLPTAKSRRNIPTTFGRRKLLTDLRRLSDEIPTDVKQSVGIQSELSNLKRLYNGHIYLSATVTWFVGIPSENTDGILTTLLLIGMSSECRRNIPTNFRRLQQLHFLSECRRKVALTGPVGNFRGNVPNNKRPRFPNGDVSQRSPTRAGFPGQSKGEKRHKESESYWTTNANSGRDAPPKSMDRRRLEGDERYPHHQGKTIVWNRLDDRPDGRDIKKPVDYNSRPRQTSMERHERQRGRESPSRTVTNPKHQSAPTPEKADSQQTISGGLQVRNGPDGQGTIVLVDPHAILTRDNGTFLIREGGIRSSPPAPRSVSPPLRLRDESEELSLDLVNLMNSNHIDDMVLTREEEAEVDKLADEFGDVNMDEDMIQNDDLLIDEPGYDAEIIDAISQLSSANAVNKENGAMTGAEKEPQPTTMNQMKNKSAGSSKIPQASSGQRSSSIKEAQCVTRTPIPEEERLG